MKPFALELQDLTPLEAFARVQALPYSLFFDSADQTHPDSRYSYVLAYPCEMIEAQGKTVRITNLEKQETREACPFECVQERLDIWSLELEHDNTLPPFQGGAAGLFGYDLARSIEALPDTHKHNDFPDMAVGIYDQVLAFDHERGKCWLITQAADEDQAKRKRRPVLSMYFASAPPRRANTDAITWEAEKTVDQYKADIQCAIDYIHNGDAFQVNLSRRFTAARPMNFDAFEHYRTLREINAAPYAGYMNLGGVIVSSASPECFLSVQDGAVITKPIKGTVPHVADTAQDDAYKAKLLDSAKDKAENVMIVDLLRNDLSKTCEAESVVVEELCALETFSKVHHLVSTVRGRLKKGYTALNLFKACFPGGSITGAPKVRAMEIIEELETARRGPYCGSMAYIGFDGMMNSNILIRTLVYDGSHIILNSGGGITAQSIPAEEHQETLDKAEAIFQSFDHTDFWDKKKA